MHPVKKLHELGQSIWYDNIERSLLEDGSLQDLIERDQIRGVTSNPSIFHNAIVNSNEYDAALDHLAKAGAGHEAIYETLAMEDIRTACDLFMPLYQQSAGADGYVSLEVSPLLAHDTQATIADAARLWSWIDRPNLMIKIPGTQAGLAAISETIAAGINVNVTLIFSLQRYAEIMEAYLVGLERRLANGDDLGKVASVASFFVSRIDSAVDERLQVVVEGGGSLAQRAKVLRGQLAIACAKLAYAHHQEVFSGGRWDALAALGARRQRLLWASTGTKNPDYPDTKYVDNLIGPHTINTMPPQTLAAFADHGHAAQTLDKDLESAQLALQELAELGIRLSDVTNVLEEQGVQAFAQAFASLLESIEVRRQAAI